MNRKRRPKIAIAILTISAVLSVFAGFIAPYKPNFMNEYAIKKQKVIVTNNQIVKEFYLSDKKGYAFQYDIVFLKSLEELFVFVRDLIHVNWHLLNNPMAGNIPLHKHPFRSMALEKGSSFDTRSLYLWDSAKERLSRGKRPDYSIDVIEDFAHLDFILFQDNLPF